MSRTLHRPRKPHLPQLPQIPQLPQRPQLPDLPQVAQLPDIRIPDIHLPHLPQIRKKKEKKRRKLLPFLILIGVVALIVSRRRGGAHSAAVGTAPAGAKPMPERDPMRASTTTTSTVETSAPTATPGTTGGTTMGVTGASSSSDLPTPINEEDAPGTLTPDELAKQGPDIATWVESNQGETETSGGSDNADERDNGTETQAEERTADGSSEGSDSSTIPTPAAESTAITANEGEGWIQVEDQTSCPPEFPIKGNANSRIYHVPGSRMYDPTIPEICFATEEAAVARGYRAPKG